MENYSHSSYGLALNICTYTSAREYRIFSEKRELPRIWFKLVSRNTSFHIVLNTEGSDQSQGTTTADPSNRPFRRSSKALFASESL